MNEDHAEGLTADRLTISLGPGQRKMLEQIADLNGMKLAQVVRYAVSKFISDNKGKQISLQFPKEIGS